MRNGLSNAEDFERQARNAKMQALLVAALHKICGVLGIMALTWATAVLLEGFVADLSLWDFYLISFLLLAESVRLFIIEIVIKLVSGILYCEKRDPAEFEFTDKQPELVRKLNFVGQILGGGVAFVSLSFTFYRIRIRGSSRFSARDGPIHIIPSLWIFYVIVILNSLIAILSVALHLLFRNFQRITDTSRGNKHADSLATFYDTIYRTAVEHGMTAGGEVDLLDFAFQKIANDLKR